MTDPYSPVAGALGTSGMIDIDLPCRKCGYNLRGLSTAGRCPECGAAAGLSVRGDFLQFSDPQWLRGMGRGINFIIGAIAVLILGLIATIPLSMSNRSLGQGMTQLVNLAASVMSFIGGWLLTQPDPSGLGEDQYGTARKLIRVCLAIGIVSHPFNILRESLAPPPAVRFLLALIIFAATVFGLIGQFAQLHYLEKLAQRIPDEKLSARAHFLKFAIAITYGAILIFGAATGIAAFARSGSIAMLFGCPTAIAFVALIVFGIMYLLMLEKMGNRFKQEAQIAEQTWAKIDVGPATPGAAV